VFYISAAIYVFGTVFYAVFGSGQLQSWAVTPSTVELQDLEIDVNDRAVEKTRKSTT